MSALNSQENNSGLLDQNIPQWKRELILKRRALGRTLQAGNVCMKLTCPTTAAPIGRNDDSIATAGVAENISGKQQRCTSSVVAVVSNKSSLDQNEADFHPGSSSSSAGSVLNMRLVEVDHRLRGTNDLVSGSVSATNKVMLDNLCAYKCVVNTNNKMGEEKSITIKRPNNGTTKSISENKYIVKRKQQTRSAIVKSVSENKTTMEEDECNSDSSEELKYGPGIVNKLKTKYLSMTLRENQKRGVRPSLSNLRRATSLENMLEDDNVKSQQNVTSPTTVNSNNVNTLKTNGDKINNKSVNNNRSAVISYPYNFSRTVYGRKNVDSIMKRACSMDTLLHSDNNIQPNKSVIMRLNKTIEKDNSGINCKKTIASIANEDLIIVENNTPSNKDNTSNNLKLNNHESKNTTGLQPSQRNTRTLKTSTSVEEKELPPPDVVKQTLKKFESAPKTKSNVLQNKNISKTVNLQNSNNKPLRTINRGTNNSVIQNDKQISMLNKPVLSPKPILNTTEKRTIINRSSKILSSKSSPSVKMNSNSEKCNVTSKTDTSQQKTNIIKSVIPENRPSSVVNNSKEVISSVVSDNGVTNDKILTPQQKNQTSSVKNVQNIKSVVCVASNNENSTNLLEDSVSPVVNNLKTDQKSVESDAVTSSSSSTAVLVSSSSDLSDDCINNSDEDIDEVDSKISAASKSVSASALENIRKGGTSLKFNFKTSNDEDDSKNILKKSYLPTSRDPPTAQATNTSLLTSQATSPIIKGLTTSPIKEQDISPVKPAAQIQMKQVGVIRPILNTNTKSPPPPPPVKSTTLTDLEIEKNLINRVKSIEQPVSKVVVAIKTLPDSVLLGAVQSDLSSNKNLQTVKMPNSDIKNRGLWSDKKPWHQNQNTMIFNFSDRKDVPDYIENDGLILKGKRDRPRPGEGGFIFLGGSGAGAATSRGQESSTDDADEDSDDWSGFADPPSPCDVCFVNDNVLINGKSNLRKHPKQRKLRIQFKEEATTFEYPSESSLAEQMGGGGGASGITADNNDDDRTKSSPSSQSSPRTSPTSSTITSSSSSVPSAPCLGSSNLASYTPSKLGEAEGWQPGITRHTPLNNTNNNNSNNTSSSTSSSADDSNTNAEYLKPATPEQTVAWSEATAADLLF